MESRKESQPIYLYRVSSLDTVVCVCRWVGRCLLGVCSGVSVWGVCVWRVCVRVCRVCVRVCVRACACVRAYMHACVWVGVVVNGGDLA